jgi:Ran-binding protein 3
VQEPATHENRSQSPVKKSRALSTPVEVDENDNDEQDGDFVFVDTSDHEDPAPSPQPSPPHELKVRPISEGVEDTVGGNEQDTLQDSRDAVPVLMAPPELQSQIGTSSPISVVTTPELQNQAGIGEASTGDAAAQIGEPTTTASVVPDAAPPPAAVLSATKEDPASSSAKPSQPDTEPTHETNGQGSLPSHDESTYQNANLPETKRPTPPPSEVDGATKRPREDEDSDLDPNPREAKRASPPPEKDKDKEKTEKPARKKSGAGIDLHPLSAPASPRSRPASVFVGRSLSRSCET